MCLLEKQITLSLFRIGLGSHITSNDMTAWHAAIRMLNTNDLLCRKRELASGDDLGNLRLCYRVTAADGFGDGCQKLPDCYNRVIHFEIVKLADRAAAKRSCLHRPSAYDRAHAGRRR